LTWWRPCAPAFGLRLRQRMSANRLRPYP